MAGVMTSSPLLEPTGDVGRVLGPRSMCDAEIGHHEAGRQLTDHFVHGVFRRAEAPSEVAIQPMGCTYGLGTFVTKTGIVARRVDEALEWYRCRDDSRPRCHRRRWGS